MNYTLEKIFPALPRVERGKPLVIGEDPKGEYLLYTNGTGVIIRNVKNFCDSDTYTQHSVQVNAAKYSPSRYYIASADSSGKVRIWDSTQKEHVLKNEFQPFGGPINDLAWTADNQRIIVGGCGRGKFGAVFNMETGASTGEIMGMSRPINSVDFRPTRPFRCISGGEDSGVCYFEGPPFKFKSSSQKHTNFVNVVRYSPTGKVFVTGGADGKIFSYNGETGEYLKEVGNPAHSGGIYGLAFSPDGCRLVSVSGDKSIKLWALNDLEIVELSKHQFDNQVNNMLLGCAWIGDTVVAVSLGSGLHLFDAPASIQSLTPPRLTLRGHSKPITSASYCSRLKRFLSASSDGTLASWDLQTGLADMFSGSTTHTNQIQAVQVNGDYAVTVGIDDRCVLSSIESHSFHGSLKLPSQPRVLSVLLEKHRALIACVQHLVLIDTSALDCPTILSQTEMVNEPVACAASAALGLIVIGTANGLTFHSLSDTNLKELNSDGVKINGHPIITVFSPNDRMLAIADSDRTLTVYHVESDPTVGGDTPHLKSAISDWWKFHTARITCLAWSPDGRRLATGSLDTSIIVWSLDSPKVRIHIQNAHPMSQITSINWIDSHTLVSTGQDAGIRCWHID